jgi:hypothetical protein
LQVTASWSRVRGNTLPPHAVQVVAEHPDTTVAIRAQQSAHALRRVVVVDNESGIPVPGASDRQIAQR